MAHGQNARSNGHNREYWSRRPYSMTATGSGIKRMTCRKERRSIHRAEVRAAVSESSCAD